MIGVTAGEMEQLRFDAESSMPDLCIIGVPVGGSKYGSSPQLPVWNWELPATACGVDITATREVAEGRDVALTDVTIRLPLAQEVGASSRIQVTHRRGTALDDPEYYAVIGEPLRGASAWVCRCQHLAGNAAL